MENYLKVLGLDDGATQNEIKRAYFSLVRQYSPEENPEKFREIREAYEYLQKKEVQDGPIFPEPSDPLAKKLLSHIEEIKKRRNSKLTRDACEEALHLFPNEIQFLYLLAVAQRKAQNTGKAVKNCELLVKREPENKWFWRELALSYMERGYTKKAFTAFEKAYEMGCRDNDFILMFSMECENYGEYETGSRILFELVRQKKRWEREQVPDILEAYSGLISMNEGSDGGHFTEIVDSLCEFMKAHTIFLEENLFILFSQIQFFINSVEFHKGNMMLVGNLISVLEKACRNPEYKEEFEGMRDAYTFACMDNDDRFTDTVKRGAEIVFSGWMEPQIRKYAMLDTELCMIEEREEMLGQFEIIRQEYPKFYEEFRRFAEQLRAGDNLENLKSSLLQQYVRYARMMEGGYYFKKYPQEKERVFGTVIHSGAEGEPYVRSGKKVGRNDPCPCGSGKKYKHCCGR